jgi:hypothetical protein
MSPIYTTYLAIGLQVTILLEVFIIPIRSTFLTSLILRNLIAVVIFCEEYEIMMLFIV